MSDGTKIEWATATWNPVVGCTKVSPACAHCYAERMAARLAAMGQAKYCGVIGDDRRWAGTVAFDERELLKPLKWRKPRRIFVVSMGDLFHDQVPFEFIAAVLGICDAASMNGHTMMLLTKRPQRAVEFYRWIEAKAAEIEPLGPRWTRQASLLSMMARCYTHGVDHLIALASGKWPLPNVWLGVTAEDQQRADERIPLLLQCPAAIRFVSVEPMLGPVSIARHLEIDMSDLDGPSKTNLHWVICGGESGPGARPIHPDWARGLRDQCAAEGVPFYFKQMSKRGEIPADLMVRQFPEVSHA